MGTGVLELLGGESRTGMYGVAQTRTRLLGRRTLNPQAAKHVLSECAIPTSRQNLSQIQYLNPLPVARASRGSKVTLVASYNYGVYLSTTSGEENHDAIDEVSGFSSDYQSQRYHQVLVRLDGSEISAIMRE